MIQLELYLSGGVKMNSITRTASLGLHSAWRTAVQLFSGLRRESLLDSDFMCGLVNNVWCVAHWICPTVVGYFNFVAILICKITIHHDILGYRIVTQAHLTY